MNKIPFLFIFTFLSVVIFSKTNASQFNPDTTILNLGPDFNLCVGYIHLLDAGSGFDSYLWQDGSTSQTFMVTEAGVYWVHAYIGSTMYADTIAINYWPYPDPNLGNDTTICYGNSIMLEPTQGYFSYLWMDGSTLPYFNVTGPGLYYVSVMDVHGCAGSDSIVIDFTTPFNLGNDTIICDCDSVLLDAGEGYLSYVWQDGSTSQYFLVVGSAYSIGLHTFSVTVIDTNNCENTDEIDIYIEEEYQNLTQNRITPFQIHPNPANSTIKINFRYYTEAKLAVELMDSFGRLVMKEDMVVVSSNPYAEIDISNLCNGIYYLRIIDNRNQYLQKILIHH
ncbi:MAG: T9SS type A sorting domain-containing protein [Bacteroidales bacterium]|nr:T9SS type A sorting domain-containing protein [Bacteroidales bacterium]MCF8403418.1 T9SS type A sorting domain-containing protein [Bacteroidales bacterium]